MEATISLSLVFWMAGAIATLLTGCWAIFKYFDFRLNKHAEESEKKVARIYERMDENKEQYYKDFVTQKVYEAHKEASKENIDQRFQSLVLLFNEKIESLRTEIRGLVKNNNHQGG